MGFINFVQKSDMFGHPVALTFRGSSKHKTIIGGFVSIIFRMGLLSYFIWRLNKIELQTENILDLIGNFGGISYFLQIIFNFLLKGISEHSFTIKAIENLFYAKTKFKLMFDKNLNSKDKRIKKLKSWSTSLDNSENL